MKTIGITGRHRDASAALAVDGRIVAAASEECFARMSHVGYAATGGAPLRSVEACLRAAAVDAEAVDAVVFVDEPGGDGHPGADDSARRLPVPLGVLLPVARTSRHNVSPVDADALQAAASIPAAGAVLVCSVEPAAIVWFGKQDGALRRGASLGGGDRLVCAARTAARALGLSDEEPFRSLDGVAPGDPEFVADFREAVGWREGRGVAADVGRLQDAIAAVASRAGGRFDAVDRHNAPMDHARRAVAASLRVCFAEVVYAIADQTRTRQGAGILALGGSLFGHAQLNSEIRRLFGGDIAGAFVPEPTGRSLGAALSMATREHAERGAALHVGHLGGVAIGPAYSDNEIKRTLDNCRLDYVYEPDWHRVLGRTSKLLSNGKVVAWFHGPMAFGPRPLGSRSILCDPSLRYSRENINEYLRQVPLEEPLPVAFAPAASADGIMPPRDAGLAVYDAPVFTAARDRLKAAVDSAERVRTGAHGAGELLDLLDFHYTRTRVPALIETPLSGAGEPAACTPRDAVRTFYSSAIDALVIGRFVLMKDYWLLRSDTGA
jgi:carbamoyltransferase